MNKRLFLLPVPLLGLVLGLAGADPAPVAADPAPTDTPAVVVVREFLADRASGHYDAAYALLSTRSQKVMTEKKFAAGSPMPKQLAVKSTPLIRGVAAAFTDTHNTLGYTFTVIGPDPANPDFVLVRASRPGAAGVILRLVTVIDPIAYDLRLDSLTSLQDSDPKVIANVINAVQGNINRSISHNHLKVLYFIMVQYNQDHDDIMPDADKWVDELLPYTGGKEFFHDPSAPANQAWSYAYNRNLSHKLLALDGYYGLPPATLVVLFESNSGVKNASDTGQSVPRPGRHRDQNNPHSGTDYLFADGHVKWLPDSAKPSFKLSGK